MKAINSLLTATRGLLSHTRKTAFAALAFALIPFISAKATDDVWSGGGGTTDWENTENWDNAMAGGGNFVINTKGSDVNVTFAYAYSISTSLWIENIATSDGTDTTVYFDGDTDAAGLTMAGLNIGTSDGFGSLAITNGTFVSTEDIKIANGGTGSLTISNASLSCGTTSVAKWLFLGVDGVYDSTITIGEGGNLKVYRIQHYEANTGTNKVILDGGTLTALGAGEVIGDYWTDNGASDLEITSNGGTVDTGTFDTAIESAITGAGTLYKKGSGALTLSGDLTSYTGSIQVREGSVVIPSASTSISAGAGTIKTVGESSTTFTALTVTALDLDFEDSTTYTAYWTLGGNGGYSQQSRTLADESTSNFLRIHTGTGSGDRQYTASYTLPTAVTSVSEYKIEFDWFAAQNAVYGSTSLDMGLYVYAGSDEKLRIVANPVTLAGDVAQIYLNGSTTAESTTLATAKARNYTNQPESTYNGCTGTDNQDKWYHVILRANSVDGLTVEILKYDLTTVAFAETKICDFTNVTRLYLDMNKRRSNFTAYSGFDDVLATVPAVAEFEGAGYATIDDAITAAASSTAETKTITLLNNVTGNVEMSTAGTVLSLGSFTISGSVTAASGMVVTYDENAKTWTCEADTSTYTWTNATADNKWSTPGNWLAGSATATAAPTSEKLVVIPAAESAWTIELAEMGYAKQIQVNGAVTFTGNQITVFDVDSASAVTGEAVITLGDNAGFYTGTADGKSVTVDNPLAIAGSKAAPSKINAYIKSSISSGYTITLNGNLTGSGYLTMGGTRTQHNFNGNNLEFAGSITIPDTSSTSSNNQRSPVCFGSANSTSPLASWYVYNDASNSHINLMRNGGGTWYFGDLGGQVYNNYAAYYSKNGTYIEIGARGTDSELTFYGNGRSDIIRKRGAGTLTLGSASSSIAGYELYAGTVLLQGDSAAPRKPNDGPGPYIKFYGGTLAFGASVTFDPSAYIVDSTSAIVFDDGGTSYTWATALASSNTSGFTKKGSGTLTLSAAPEYTGTTTLLAGTLKIPTSAGVTVTTTLDGYKVATAVDGDYTVYTLAEKKSAMIFLVR